MTRSSPALLEVDNLELTIGGAAIVTGVSFTVAEGEFVAVIGPNGAGKTSLFNLLSGVRAASAGSIRMEGQEITRATPYARARLGLGRSFQSSSVFAGLPVGENVRLAAQAGLGGSLRIWDRVRRGDRAQELAEQALGRVGLGHRGEVLAGSLSHGEKRKLEVAILLAGQAKVLLLDEPMAGVSAEDVADLTQLIGEVNRNEGRTVLMVEHHMEVVLGLADRVAVMHHGALLALDTPDAVIGNATVQEAYLGEPI